MGTQDLCPGVAGTVNGCPQADLAVSETASPNPRIADRVVTVSSGAHRTGRVRLDDLNWEHGDCKRWGAYGQSKLANLLFTLELQRRLQAAGSDALAAHPGYAATNLQQRTENLVQNTVMAITNRLIAQSDEMGALPTLCAATQDLPGASYVGPDGFREQRGHPTAGRAGVGCRDVGCRLSGATARRGQLAARSTARIRGWPSISGWSMTSTSSRPTMRASRCRPSGEKPQ